jgi:hypothetical protein
MTNNSGNPMEQESYAVKGREAARQLWEHGLAASEIDDPLTKDFAHAALAEFEHLLRGTPGLIREVLDGAQKSAEQLNVEPFHGVNEIIQNADDSHGSEVRVAIHRKSKQRHLLVAHNGDRIQLPHVLAMTLAFVSTKREDPRSKGRFGIGLKTLARLGDVLTVHCAPYHFRIEGNHVHTAKPAKTISGFFDPATTDTLFDLQLHQNLDVEELKNWFAQVGAESLVFLDAVRALKLLRIGDSKPLLHYELTDVSKKTVKLPGVSEPCQLVVLEDRGSERRWERFEIERSMPNQLGRRYKARADATPIAIALSSDEEDQTQIYAGLPLRIFAGLPFSINAQFDPDVARKGLQHEALNKWLFEQLADLTTAVAQYRFLNEPSAAWRAIPLRNENSITDDSWLRNRIAVLIDHVQSKLRKTLRIAIDGDVRKLNQLAYEATPLEGVIGPSELTGLRPQLTLLSTTARDKVSRWRRVLGELGDATCINVAEAIRLFDWGDKELGSKDVKWFIRLAQAGLEDALGETLWKQRSIVAATGERIVPPMPHVEGELLLRHDYPESLASRLGLAHVIHSAYLTDQKDAEVVRTWLEKNGMLRASADAEATLRALGTHDWQEKFPRVNDEELRLIRDALASISPSLQKELGAEVGKAIHVEVHQWISSKRTSTTATPAQAYLSASIEDRKDGWTKAAGRTEGISWIHPRYQDVLSKPEHRVAVSAQLKPLASRALFGLLGAEDAPRLLEPEESEKRYNDPATPIEHDRLARVQVEALNKLSRYATHLKHDRYSPDLFSVLKDIQKERKLSTRRDRARALLNTLEREWERLYSDHTEAIAVYSSNTWHTAGSIPATWLGHAMSETWLSSEDGKKKAPIQLAVRTPATQAIFGNDRTFFANEIDARESTAPLIKALQVETDPQVSEMVEQLKALREAKLADEERTALLYAAIAANCKKRDPAPDDLVGDLPLRKLRARFGTQSDRPGLIYTTGVWLPPSKVFLGKAIFKNRQAFVSEHSAAEQLWRALKIKRPSIQDCIDVLIEISRSALIQDDEELLVNTYLYLNSELEKASEREASKLASLPLWTGHNWQTTRPVFVIADTLVADDLSGQIPVWKLPVSINEIPYLLSAAKASVLNQADFRPVCHTDGFLRGDLLREQFTSAVTLLRDWLARHDTKLYTAITVSWDELATSRIAIDPQLALELKLDGYSSVSVTALAHLSYEPLTFYANNETEISHDDSGGLAISSVFAGGDLDKLGLAWNRSWQRMIEGDRGAITLAQDEADSQELDKLFEQASATPPPKAKRVTPKAEPITATEVVTTFELQPRRLKTLEDIQNKFVETNAKERYGKRKSNRRGLKSRIPSGREIAVFTPASPNAPLAYSENEKEHFALQALQTAINGELSELSDYRHLRGIGADALDKLKRYFEIKTYYGRLPDEITLTHNESVRALREREKSVLAVIAGLEVGYDTVVKVFNNPLRTLEIKPNTTVILGGITTKETLTVWLSAHGDTNEQVQR